MQPTTSDTELKKQPKNTKAPKIKGLRPAILDKHSNYDPPIPRKFVEAFCGISTGTLIKLESENYISPNKIKHGGLELVTYSIEDVHKVLNYKKITFKQKEEAEIISIFSQKGGVGKSAFTQHLGSMLSLVGKVLIVDLDAQSDATVLLGLDANFGDLVMEDSELPPTIAELMDWTLADGEEGPYESREFNEVVKSIAPSLDVIPSDLDLGEINYSLNRLPLKPRVDADGNKQPPQLFMIKEVFDKIKYKYDFILLDCPPNIETCNISALFASNRVIIPLELEAKSLTTMNRNASLLERLMNLHPGFHWDQILVVPNKFRRENIKIKALAALEDRYRDSDFLTLSEVVVPNSSIIDKCSDWKKPIYSLTTPYGTTARSAVPQAKEFTNYFWAIMHEILGIELNRLVFNSGEGRGE